MKKPIYLDERERDLISRCLKFLVFKLDDDLIASNKTAKLAATWMRHEIEAVLPKFAAAQASATKEGE